MKRQTIAALVVISVLLGSAVHVMPVSATPTAQASGGFAERTGSYDFDMLRLIRA
jgi:tetrahydromethanopterin S-methyltransferase subunit D